MAIIISRIRNYNGTFYAYIPQETIAQYGLKEGDTVGIELSALKAAPLTPIDDKEALQ